MSKEYSTLWLLPVCVAIAVVVLILDLAIKNEIITEALKLRKAIESARTEANERGSGRVDNRSDHASGYVLDDV